jgi:hypothetical protein
MNRARSIHDLFVKNQLTVDTLEQGRAYQLDEDSVSPTRVVGYDKFGMPIEETICALAKSAMFVDRWGNVCCVPLQTGRVFSSSPEAVRYEHLLVKDLILEGWLPLEACPFTQMYRHLTGGPLVRPESSADEDCGGRPGAERLEQACEHMKGIVAKRRELNAERVSNIESAMMKMTKPQAAALLHQMGSAFAIVGEYAAAPDDTDDAPPAPAPAKTRRTRADG